MPEEKVSIKSLLDQLGREEDPAKKRNIRARLRAAGHAGGLGQPRGRKPGGKATGGKKRKRALAAATTPA